MLEPASEKDKADELHNALVEAAENDESLMEMFFEKGLLMKMKCAKVCVRE